MYLMLAAGHEKCDRKVSDDRKQNTSAMKMLAHIANKEQRADVPL
jgi:hypothetical protein